jgi:hypothetical protein
MTNARGVLQFLIGVLFLAVVALAFCVGWVGSPKFD